MRAPQTSPPAVSFAISEVSRRSTAAAFLVALGVGWLPIVARATAASDESTEHEREQENDASLETASVDLPPPPVLSRADAIAAVRSLGGSVLPVARGSRDLELEFHLRGRAVTDGDLRFVAALESALRDEGIASADGVIDARAHAASGHVVRLNLRDTRITGAGLAYLESLSGLRRLHLERTRVGDEGTEHLAKLGALEYLNLYGTEITDRTLRSFEDPLWLPSLRTLYVWETDVTDDGVARLEAARPRWKIVRGVDLSQLPELEDPPPPPAPEVDLDWVPIADAKLAPRSESGLNTQVFFENRSKQRVKLVWVSYGGELKLYAELEPGAIRQQNSYARNVWLVTDLADRPLGYFTVVEAISRAVIRGTEDRETERREAKAESAPARPEMATTEPRTAAEGGARP